MRTLRRERLSMALLVLGTLAGTLSVGACNALEGIGTDGDGGDDNGGDGTATGVGGGLGAAADGREGNGASVEETSTGAEVGTGGGSVNAASTGSGEGGFSGGVGGGEGVGGDPDQPPPPACYDHVESFMGTAHVVVDDSNSYASPKLVHELVADYDPERPLPVRPHEFLNHYARKIAEARLNETAAEGLHLGGDARLLIAPTATATGVAELLVTFTAHGEVPTARPDVTFVLDTSPSMNGQGTDRLAGVVNGAAQRLREEQKVAVLTWNPVQPVVREFESWNPSALPDIVAAARVLDPDANFSAALRSALVMARRQADAENRPGVIVAVSDGSTPLDDQLLRDIETEQDAQPSIRIVGIGVGPARGYSDEVFDALTDQSGGAYDYASDAESAERGLAARFDELTRLAASDVRLDISLPEGVTVAAVAGGNVFPSDDVGSFDVGRNLGVGGTMAFHLYLTVPPIPALDPCATLGVRVRWTDVLDGAARSFPETAADVIFMPFGEALADGATHSVGLLRSSAVVATAEAMRGPQPLRLKAAADLLRQAIEAGADDDGSLGSLCADLALVCAPSGTSCACEP